ncbi:hypothetical protein EYF80_068383 [Liparis tanakae]|uniref:Uncharacterized protein n=1 Tax=Liparis tanakae TaxID=230148 RepID=A0A4Z2DYD5_9TELE|nr:hypothetical protein EYF80_068383 [Liparis tanakae]
MVPPHSELGRVPFTDPTHELCWRYVTALLIKSFGDAQRGQNSTDAHVATVSGVCITDIFITDIFITDIFITDIFIRGGTQKIKTRKEIK